jgi:hypothetical protein
MNAFILMMKKGNTYGHKESESGIRAAKTERPRETRPQVVLLYAAAGVLMWLCIHTHNVSPPFFFLLVIFSVQVRRRRDPR